MGLSLMYLGEHYLIDILLGWVYAAITVYAVNWGAERLAKRRTTAAPTGQPAGAVPAEAPRTAEPAGAGR
jgi:membrane-associated phospholipid phosphatase